MRFLNEMLAWPEYAELTHLTVDLVFNPKESDEHFRARCRAVVAVRRRLREAGVTVARPDAFEAAVLAERWEAVEP